MAKPIPPEMLRDLRHHLASAISDAKAYEVPALCRRLNLADGSEQEAFASKYKYAQKRLAEVSGADVIESARAYLIEKDHFGISEQVAKIDDLEGSPITTLTRRRLIALFERGPLATEVDDIELIRSVWPISKMPAPSQGPGYTLEDDIFRPTVRNDDWSQRQLLEAVGFLTCSRMFLFKFLAAVTAPDVQTTAAQMNLAAGIDRYLRNDGYTLAIVGKISERVLRPVTPNSLSTFPGQWLLFSFRLGKRGKKNNHNDACAIFAADRLMMLLHVVVTSAMPKVHDDIFATSR
jgi:hypothetical protein